MRNILLASHVMGITRGNGCRMPGILKVITNGMYYLSYNSVTWPQSPERRNDGPLIERCDIRPAHLEILLNMAFVVKSC